MQLYFSPLSCSMATRIAFHEAGVEASFIEVDPKTKLTSDGKNFREIHPLGLVPTLRTDDGDILTENAAILQYVADFFPKAKLAPTDRMERARLHQWLCFIGTELHKALFVPLLDAKAPEAVKAYALEKEASRLSHLEKHLTGREFLLDRFSVADAYLFTVLNWTQVTPVDLKKWPAISAYVSRLRDRPSVAKAFAEERVLYMEEQARHKKANA
ncbi:glutathione binding-like protein [Vitiosangium sp. GDMCC 1.1324]|uniref:glutathione binding-like protein n=1 Tax=Vitiosangium sp. (strain GDMCC 1.1324) TaxID=2138576 RepID=UPI000D373CFF|nr:glutathione binding-like protein [Vitiosangium sp. GDMCC 1.1324]PTL81655.1 glutathione S-transferase [Vitiosangium sp. GDMCC 1.1324]